MEDMIDYGFIVNQLAKSYLKWLNSLDKSDDDLLLLLINHLLKKLDQDLIANLYHEHQLLRSNTHRTLPKQKGMYLKLLHGRKNPDEELQDWGADGPWIGPLVWFHCTYFTEIGLAFSDKESISYLHEHVDYPAPMHVHQNYIYYDGLYYGDWTLYAIAEQKNRRKKREILNSEAS